MAFIRSLDESYKKRFFLCLISILMSLNSFCSPIWYYIDRMSSYRVNEEPPKPKECAFIVTQDDYGTLTFITGWYQTTFYSIIQDCGYSKRRSSTGTLCNVHTFKIECYDRSVGIGMMDIVSWGDNEVRLILRFGTSIIEYYVSNVSY